VTYDSLKRSFQGCVDPAVAAKCHLLKHVYPLESEVHESSKSQLTEKDAQRMYNITPYINYQSKKEQRSNSLHNVQVKRTPYILSHISSLYDFWQMASSIILHYISIQFVHNS